MTTYTFADDPDTAIDFGGDLYVSAYYARELAQEHADHHDTPTAVWQRDGWYCICDVPPDMIEPNPEDQGWALVALRSPQD